MGTLTLKQRARDDTVKKKWPAYLTITISSSGFM